MRLFARAAAAAWALAVGATPAALARPFTLDDLVHEESIGAAEIDPSGRWAVIEARAPYDSLGAYRYGLFMEVALSRLWRADLLRGGPARPLLPDDIGPGVIMAGFSPSGRTLAVYRLDGGRWTLGLVTVASGDVRWLAVTPDGLTRGRTIQWLTDDTLLVLARTDGALPWTLRQFGVASERYPGYWAATARGEASVKVLGSGAYLGLRARAAPLALLRVDARSGAVDELARGAFTDMEIAPGGRRVALFEATQDLQPRADGPAQGAAGTQTEAQRLVLLDLASGRASTPLPGVDALPNLLAWSPSGRSVLVYGRAPGAVWTSGRLVAVEAETGRSRAVLAPLSLDMTFRPEVVGAGWMGETPVAFGRVAGATRSDWHRETAEGLCNLTGRLRRAPRTLASLDPGGLLALVDGEVWRVDRGGGVLRLRSAPARATAPARTSAPGRTEVTLPRSSWLAVEGRLVRAVGGGLSPSPLRIVPGDLVGVAPVGDRALVRRQDASGRQTLLGVDARGASVLLTANAALAETTPPRIRPVRHLGPGGEALTSWLYLPPDRGGPPPPLVIVPYPGPRWSTAPQDHPGEPGYPISIRLMVAHGYAVLMPSLPYAPDDEPMAELGPRIEAVARVAAAQPDLADAFDPDRMALWGFSFGGYTVAAALAQTEAFKAGVAIAGPMDFISKWAATHPVTRPAPDEGVTLNWTAGNTENGQNRMHRPPWADPQRYLRNSPFFAADRIRAPLLLAHGDQDSIELAQSEAMFAALYRQSKDAVFLTYWGESHGLASPGNIRDFYTRAFAFLDQHLGRLNGASGPNPPRPEPASASSAPTPPRPPPTGDAMPPAGP